jgi:hypothetical protein
MTDDTIADGFGNVWNKCLRADCSLQVVRPGKVQCDTYKVDGKSGPEWVDPCLWNISGTTDEREGSMTAPPDSYRTDRNANLPHQKTALESAQESRPAAVVELSQNPCPGGADTRQVGDVQTVNETARQIEEQQDEIERLRTDRDRWRSVADSFADAGTHPTAHAIAFEEYEAARRA